MSDFVFWVWKPIGEFLGQLLLIFILLLLILLVAGIVEFIKHLRQKYCKHTTERNSRTLDVVCTKCGKNFGFISEEERKEQ